MVSVATVIQARVVAYLAFFTRGFLLLIKERVSSSAVGQNFMGMCWGFAEAHAGLSRGPDLVLCDGLHGVDCPVPAQGSVRGLFGLPSCTSWSTSISSVNGGVETTARQGILLGLSCAFFLGAENISKGTCVWCFDERFFTGR
ncbi:unnamed protein product [Discosporangium mesarthrocarpum]